PTDTLTHDVLAAIRDKADRVCPVGCTARQAERDGHCVAKSCPRGFVLAKDGSCQQALGISGVAPNGSIMPAPTKDPAERAARPEVNQKPVIGALSKEPAPGTLQTGQLVLVDDGSCPRGQIKEVIGGNQRMLEYHIPRRRRCVPR